MRSYVGAGVGKEVGREAGWGGGGGGRKTGGDVSVVRIGIVMGRKLTKCPFDLEY